MNVQTNAVFLIKGSRAIDNIGKILNIDIYLINLKYVNRWMKKEKLIGIILQTIMCNFTNQIKSFNPYPYPWIKYPVNEIPITTGGICNIHVGHFKFEGLE